MIVQTADTWPTDAFRPRCSSWCQNKMSTDRPPAERTPQTEICRWTSFTATHEASRHDVDRNHFKSRTCNNNFRSTTIWLSRMSLSTNCPLWTTQSDSETFTHFDRSGGLHNHFETLNSCGNKVNAFHRRQTLLTSINNVIFSWKTNIHRVANLEKVSAKIYVCSIEKTGCLGHPKCAYHMRKTPHPNFSLSEKLSFKITKFSGI